MKIKFGTEGWRGVIADDFTVTNVEIVTAATARYLQEANAPGGGVIVGHDCRMMGELFSEKCGDVLNSFGFDVITAPYPTSTPALSYGVIVRRGKGACVFTASHNPGIFQGLKFKPYYGGAAITPITNAIEAQLYKGDSYGSLRGGREAYDFVPDYLAHLAEQVDVGRIEGSGMTLAFDAMYGAGAGQFQKMFPKMPITAIRQERNPIFPGIHPEPIADQLVPLFEAVRGKSLGIALDGDADRIGAVDEQGNFVDSHRIFAVAFKHLVERRGEKGNVAKTLTTTRMIDKLAKNYGVECYVTPVGFKWIVDKMLEGGLLMGGEESGGIGVTSNMPERDAMLMSLLLMEAMVMSGKTLSGLVQEVFNEVGPHYYDRIDAQFERNEMVALKDVVGGLAPRTIGGLAVNETNRMDGVLFELEEGQFLMLRASGTEPVVRIYAEAKSPQIAGALCMDGEKLLRDALKGTGF